MSFQQGLSGLGAASKGLDTISNNVSNGSTAGFKSSAAMFSDVYAASISGGSAAQAGIGVNISAIRQNFTQGNITVTNNPLDLAINGGGFFRVNNAGTIGFTRAGQFQVDKNGFIVNSTGAHLTGYPANSSGIIVPSSPTDIVISSSDLTPTPTTIGTIGLNLDSRATVPTNPFLYTDPTTYNSSTAMTVYDSLGNSHVMTMYFTKTASNTWQVYTGLDGAAPTPIAGTMLDFTSTGAVNTGGIVAVSFPLTNGAVTPLALTLDMNTATQFGSTFGVNSMAQDGFTSGRLSGLTVGDDGVIQGRYSNGLTKNLGQIVLTNFANLNGLQPQGNSTWAETSTSGQPLIGTPNSGSLGALQSAAIEESNVDLTAELVSMITAQRNYQANAQSIKTQDSIMQTLVNLR